MQDMLWLNELVTWKLSSSSRTKGGIVGPAGSHMGSFDLHDCSNGGPKQEFKSELFTVQVLMHWLVTR